MKRKIDFIKNRKIFFGISIGLLLVGVLLNFAFGTNFDIQFRGGTMISYTYEGDINEEEAARLVEGAIGLPVTVQSSQDRLTDTQKLVINVAGNTELATDQMDKVSSALSETYGDTGISYLQANSVNPTKGRDFFYKSLMAVLLAFVVMILYIGIRFRKIGGLSAGVFAVLALLHDVLLVYFTFVILGISINDNFIAAVLTILGYSINGTIVVYDRIRENRKIMGPKVGIAEIVNTSINQSLTRTLNTTLTTVISLGTISVFAVIYDISSILSFSVPMLVGALAGCYSSTFVTGPLWVLWRQRKEKKLNKPE